MTRRAMLQNEISHWFGSLAEEIEIVAGGNLWYNMVAMVEGGLGVGLSIDLNCKYENVTFIPLSPGMESRTALAWKKGPGFLSGDKGVHQTCQEFWSTPLDIVLKQAEESFSAPDSRHFADKKRQTRA